MNPKVVVFDLDGTLAESKTPVTKEMGVLLAKLLEEHIVAVMSGGAWQQFALQLLPALPSEARFENLFLFPVSAGYCYAYKEGAWVRVYDNSFTPEEKQTVLGALESAMKETGFEPVPLHTWGPRIEDRGAQITFSGLGQQAPIEEKEKWDPDRSKRTPLYEALRKRLPSYAIRMNATTSIDITKNDISKAYGVRKLSELEKVPVNEMLYVGDALFPGGNDASVKETGIATEPVKGPEDTARLIERLI